MAEYYVQRASAGLILTEATSVTPQGVGYADTPGIWSAEQVAGWKLVTQAVHQNHHATQRTPLIQGPILNGNVVTIHSNKGGQGGFRAHRCNQFGSG